MGRYALRALRLLAIGWLVWGMSGCGGPATPVRFSRVAGYLPEETPYALVTSTLGMTEEGFRGRYLEVLGDLDDNFFVESFRATFQEVLGIDILEPETLEWMGLDLRGDVALFGLGLQPAVLVRLGDRERLRTFVEELRARNPELIVTDTWVRGESVYTLHLGVARVTYTEVGGGYLLAVLHRGRQELDVLLEPFVGGRPERTLGRSGLLREGLTTLEASYDTVVWLNLERLDGLLLEAARARGPAEAMWFSGEAREALLAEEAERLERCGRAGRALASEMPWAVMGVRVSEAGWEQRVRIPLSQRLARSASAVLPPLPINVEEAFGDAAVRLGWHVDWSALVGLEGQHPELVYCPNLAALSGAVDLMAGRLAGTDAAEVLEGPVYAALIDFDALFAGLSQRDAHLWVEARDFEAVERGLTLFFTGLGMGAWVEPEEGLRYVDLGPFSVSVRTVEGHVVVSAGRQETEALRSRLTDAGLPTGDFAYLGVKGAALSDILGRLVAQLNVFGAYDTTALSDLTVLLGRVESVTVNARIYEGALQIDAVLKVVEGVEAEVGE